MLHVFGNFVMRRASQPFQNVSTSRYLFLHDKPLGIKRSLFITAFLILGFFYLVHYIVVSFQVPDNTFKTTPTEQLDMSVLWLAPFLSGSGYGVEALSFIKGLHKHVRNLTIYHFGDIVEDDYLQTMSKETEALLKQLWATNETLPQYFIRRQYEDEESAQKMHSKMKVLPDGKTIREPVLRPIHDVVIIQSLPLGWRPYLFETAKYRVGRTVFETDRLPDGWVEHCNHQVDEVWVPTEFNRKTFTGAGVYPHMLDVLPQTVDTETFGRPKVTARPKPQECNPSDFIFLSVFRWGGRKGTEFLLEAYIREFSPDDPVCLVLLTATHKAKTNATYYHGLIHAFADDLGVTSAIRPRIAVLEPSISNEDMPGLYAMADTFVLPSRGEGWGRPYTEAMIMNVPVIATNWSAHTEFITPETGYLIKVEKMDLYPSDDEEMSNYWGHLLSRPSVCHLKQLMRHVLNNPQEAKKKAFRAKKLVYTKYHQNAVTNQILEKLRRIKKNLTSENVNRMLAKRVEQIIAHDTI